MRQLIITISLTLTLAAWGNPWKLRVNDSVILVLESDDSVLDTLDEDTKQRFLERRESYLRFFAAILLKIEPAIAGAIRAKHGTFRLFTPNGSTNTPREEAREQIRLTVENLNQRFLESAQLVANSTRSGIQLGFGGHLGAAIANRGLSEGLWVNAFIDLPNSLGSTAIHWNIDFETLQWVVPGILTGGVGIKVMYFIASDGEANDRGIADYPCTVIPDVQITQRTLSFGYKFGFYIPTHYVLYMRKTLYRSGSVVMYPAASCAALMASFRNLWPSR